ncbi:Phosphatidylglycerophosphatase A [Usitatibacter rugosus]|uniref:Phosphatidylglycerophosphatase A n=1 Tax=Usitatibacter rugosus TaxID=2732067 RepID=A0A6M4GU88_9PROT|nr:phosphatidylglycerophosphatase A [Usitatibacter rugosus]QJR10565.1 Phosphatidylglycerophosphatase A [Usitatibacter rugosus]
MATASTISRRPDARFLLAHPAHFIALGFGAGLAPKAPGTFGTVVGLLLCWALQPFLPPLAIALLAIPLFLVGIWACGVTGRALGVMDSGSIVWDEVVAFLPLAAFAATIGPQVFAFVLFRLFDIWKPFPIRQLEKRIPGGLGVMADDVLAALYAFICFYLTYASLARLPA